MVDYEDAREKERNRIARFKIQFRTSIVCIVFMRKQGDMAENSFLGYCS